MKTLSTLKTLPLVGLLALGVALAPVASQAGPSKHSDDRASAMHDKGKGHGSKGHSNYGHYKAPKHHAHKSAHVRAHNHNYGHVHKHHGHKHHAHKHHGHGHRHADYVVVHDHHDDYDPFRLMLGLHFDHLVHYQLFFSFGHVGSGLPWPAVFLPGAFVPGAFVVLFYKT